MSEEQKVQQEIEAFLVGIDTCMQSPECTDWHGDQEEGE